MGDELKGWAAAGFTPGQAEFLGAMLNILKAMAEVHALGAREEIGILRRVLESKGLVAAEEIEAEKGRTDERFRTTLELESMMDPALKRGLEQLEDLLRRRNTEDEMGGPRQGPGA